MAGLLRPDEPFVAVHPTVARTLGLPAASVLGHIAYAETDRGAYLTAVQIADAIGISRRTVLRVTKVLRHRGLLDAARSSPWDATLVYRVNWQHPIITGQIESATADLSTAPSVAPRETPDGALLLSELEEPQELPADAGTGADVTPMPDSYQDALIPAVSAEPQGPPKTAQTLVARWCDGHRESFGRDAAGPLVKRVAGQMRNMAKGCSSHDDWVAAYAAAYDAGRDGRWDAVGYMSRRQHPARGRTTNVFARPELGGTGTALDAVSAMLNTPQTPQLGGR